MPQLATPHKYKTIIPLNIVTVIHLYFTIKTNNINTVASKSLFLPVPNRQIDSYPTQTGKNWIFWSKLVSLNKFKSPDNGNYSRAYLVISIFGVIYFFSQRIIETYNAEYFIINFVCCVEIGNDCYGLVRLLPNFLHLALVQQVFKFFVGISSLRDDL